MVYVYVKYNHINDRKNKNVRLLMYLMDECKGDVKKN